jgi:hypothetical protein
MSSYGKAVCFVAHLLQKMKRGRLGLYRHFEKPLFLSQKQSLLTRSPAYAFGDAQQK